MSPSSSASMSTSTWVAAPTERHRQTSCPISWNRPVMSCSGPVESATLEWVNSFYHRRSLEPIGNTPAAEARTNCDTTTDAMDNLPMAA
jgi:hypothetical protein